MKEEMPIVGLKWCQLNDKRPIRVETMAKRSHLDVFTKSLKNRLPEEPQGETSEEGQGVGERKL